MTTDIPIRLADASDLSDIETIIRDVGLFLPDEADGFCQMTAEHFQSPEPGHSWFLAEGGTGAAYLAPEQSTGVWNLLFLGVLASARGKGLARSIIRTVEAHLRREEGRVLIVDTSSLEAMAPARALYTAMSYDQVGTIPDYWAPGDAKVIFAKSL